MKAIMKANGYRAIISAGIVTGLLVCAELGHAENAPEATKAVTTADDLDIDGCVAAARRWLDTLPPAKRELARGIMRQANPRAAALRRAINEKKNQLASINYSQGVAPEALPRLGLELQQLRRDLRSELQHTHLRLAREAYIILPPLPKDAVCLPLSPASSQR